jgi:hypothetical protein
MKNLSLNTETPNTVLGDTVKSPDPWSLLLFFIIWRDLGSVSVAGLDVTLIKKEL